MSIRVLVVDDEQLTRRSIVDFLRDWKDVEVIGECVNGTTAIKAIRQHSPDLVFLDMQMPGMNGLEVVEAIGEENIPSLSLLPRTTSTLQRPSRRTQLTMY